MCSSFCFLAWLIFQLTHIYLLSLTPFPWATPMLRWGGILRQCWKKFPAKIKPSNLQMIYKRIPRFIIQIIFQIKGFDVCNHFYCQFETFFFTFLSYKAHFTISNSREGTVFGIKIRMLFRLNSKVLYRWVVIGSESKIIIY